MSDMFFDQLLNVAQLIILVSFLVKDMMWLRFLSVIASICVINYFLTRSPPTTEGAVWNSIYLLINAYQIYKLYQARKPVRLTSEQELIHRHLFPELTPRELLNLMMVSERMSPAVGESLVKAGESPSCLYMVSEGQVNVKLSSDQEVALTQYQLIGEVSYLTGQLPSRDVVIREEGVELVYWSVEQLNAHLAQCPQTKMCLQRALSRDLARKLYQ